MEFKPSVQEVVVHQRLVSYNDAQYKFTGLRCTDQLHR